MGSQLADPSYAPHLDPERGASLKWLGAAWLTLTGITIILRFWSRATSSKKKFGADDWTALASWPFVATLNLIAAELIRAGFGRHVDEVPLGNLRKSLKILYATSFVYGLGMAMIRFSAILFYNRVFELSRSRYRYVIWCSLGINTAWLVALGTLALVPCTPIHAFWDRPLLAPTSYSCFSALALYLSSGITSVLVDLIVLILPVPRLWKLQIDWRKKARLSLVFFLGYCVIICTIGRLISIIRAGKGFDEDITWTFVTTMYWYACEISVASICISLPSIFRLVKRATSYGPAALLNDREYPIDRSRSGGTEEAAGNRGFVRLTSDTKNGNEHETRLNSPELGYR